MTHNHDPAPAPGMLPHNGLYGALVTDAEGHEYVMLGGVPITEETMRRAWAYFRAHPEEVYAGYAFFQAEEYPAAIPIYFRPAPRRDHLATIDRTLHEEEP